MWKVFGSIGNAVSLYTKVGDPAAHVSPAGRESSRDFGHDELRSTDQQPSEPGHLLDEDEGGGETANGPQHEKQGQSSLPLSGKQGAKSQDFRGCPTAKPHTRKRHEAPVPTT